MLQQIVCIPKTPDFTTWIKALAFTNAYALRSSLTQLEDMIAWFYSNAYYFFMVHDFSSTKFSQDSKNKNSKYKVWGAWNDQNTLSPQSVLKRDM